MPKTNTNVTQLHPKTKAPKRVIPKKLDAAYLEKLSQMGAAALDDIHICAVLGCSEDEFNERFEEDSEFSGAFRKGKATAIQLCAQVVLQAASGVVMQSDKLDAAKFYLEHHAPKWLKQT